MKSLPKDKIALDKQVPCAVWLSANWSSLNGNQIDALYVMAQFRKYPYSHAELIQTFQSLDRLGWPKLTTEG
jgi:hypothetical protein